MECSILHEKMEVKNKNKPRSVRLGGLAGRFSQACVVAIELAGR